VCVWCVCLVDITCNIYVGILAGLPNFLYKHISHLCCVGVIYILIFCCIVIVMQNEGTTCLYINLYFIIFLSVYVVYYKVVQI
jgi:hypothetical protein